MSKAKRYVVTYDGGFIAWQYREAKETDKGERIWFKESDYAALAAENERLRKAGDDLAIAWAKVRTDYKTWEDAVLKWDAAKEGKDLK